MNILMMTNTYAPVVGGLERSVRQFAEEYRKRGHRTLIVAPVFRGMPKREQDVVRVPVPGVPSRALRGFKPDLVHAHHPFMLGGTALRVAYARNLPLVFTHHTLFEHYTHLLPLDSPAVKRFVIRLAVGYANLCDLVFAPSRSVQELLIRRGVRSPVAVVPTGLALERYRRGDGLRARRAEGIPSGAFVVGHVGRLSPEKNLDFLARAAALFLRRHASARFLLVGEGPSLPRIVAAFRRWGVEDRLHCPGTLSGQRLIDSYHAMDLFAFSSKSETQGLVLLEAMAAGVPVAAIRGPGVVDLVRHGSNGYLLRRESIEEFAGALNRFAEQPARQKNRMRRQAMETASGLSMDRCAERALESYAQIQNRRRTRRPLAGSGWARAIRWFRAEWRLVRNYTGAFITAGSETHAGPD